MRGILIRLLGLPQLEEIVNLIDVWVKIQWPEEAQEDEFNKEDREKDHLGPQVSEMTLSAVFSHIH